MRSVLAFFCVLVCGGFPVFGAAPSTFSDVQEGARSNGFRARAVYLNDADEPFGARFTHEKTGFTLDLIQVQSVPQAFVWVTTYPTSDQGEPHTQEHLLVTKGNVGRALAANEALTLTEFTAFTDDTKTCYAFNTKAGVDVFYQEFGKLLGALTAPDYTDEEIRREVRNFGVAQNPTTHDYRLEEKGAVYNEMVSSSSNPYSVLFRQIGIDDYGAHHPLAYNAGGEPAAIREMKPSDIRKFHDEHYFLANMGAIVSLPKGQPVAATLARVNELLQRAHNANVHLPLVTEESLPRSQPAPAGSIQVVNFPFESEQQPGHIALVWPADRNLKQRQRMLLDLFVSTFAGDPDTNLYRLFINRNTRKLDIGAQGLFGFIRPVHGLPVIIALTNVAAANLTQAKVAEVRQLVRNELQRIAGFPDGSPELAEFNTRVQSRLRDERRQLSKLLNSPPRFGARDGSAFWADHLYLLNREPGFRKSLTLKPEGAEIAGMLASRKNIWRELLAEWNLTAEQPYGIAARPSASLLKSDQESRLARAAAEAKTLESKYHVDTEQLAIASYLKDYDAETARLDKLAEQASTGKFVENPPLTLDDELEYGVSKLPGGVPLVASRFNNMSSSTIGIALNLKGTSEGDLPLLASLPELLTETGVVVDGKPVPYEDMKQRLREEILDLHSQFDVDERTGRVELTVSASGNDLAESRRAIEWIELALLHPYWQPENLPRLRDLADQVASNLRESTQGPAEYWVRGPMLAYAEQRNPLYLATSSLLTKIFNANRLRWMLKDAGSDADRRTAMAFLDQLAAAGTKANPNSRHTDLTGVLALLSGEPANTSNAPESAAQLRRQLDALPDSAKRVAKDAVADLRQFLPELPDETLAPDWAFLCRQMRTDLALTPEKTLERLNALREGLVAATNSRIWMVGSEHDERQLQPLIAGVVRRFPTATVEPGHYNTTRSIESRAAEHQPKGTAANFVGYFDPNLPGGVIESMLPFASYLDTDRNSLLNFLAVQLFAGHGLHTLYTKTTGVGLAYSNGIRGTTYDGWWGYYAERVPEVPQTLHFAIDVVENQSRQVSLVEYAIAQSFQESKAADTYEARAAAIADEIADGVTPETVKKFREALVALRSDPNLAREIFARVDSVYGNVLPGFGLKAKDVPQGLYFIIGNKKQFDAMDADLFSREDQHVTKLFPRDFWMVPTEPVAAPPQ